MKPRKVLLRGEVRWVVQSYAGAQRRRFFFKTKPLAEQKARQLVADREGFGSVWLELDPRERADVCAILEEMRAKSVKPRVVWEAFKRGDVRGVVASVSVERAITEMLAAKRARNLRGNYLADLARTVRQFAAGRMEALVATFTAAEVENFVAAPESPNTRSTRRGRMLAFFAFCQRKGWTARNPCADVEKPKVDRQPPRILTIAECRAVMAYVEAEHPRALAWYALALFAGIRPEECDRVTWGAVDMERGVVKLPASTHKTRKAHTVELPANAFAWVIRAHELKALLPFPKSSRRKVLRQVRAKLGLDRWPQDVLRHSFCSYGTAHLGQMATARLADHSESVLGRHYKAQVSLSDAKEFFSIEPLELQGFTSPPASTSAPRAAAPPRPADGRTAPLPAPDAPAGE